MKCLRGWRARWSLSADEDGVCVCERERLNLTVVEDVCVRLNLTVMEDVCVCVCMLHRERACLGFYLFPQ